MKLMDEKGRFFGKFNLFDLLVVVLLLVGIIAMATRFGAPQRMEETYLNATYKVEYKGMPECYKDAFAEGDDLYEKGNHLGTVTAVEIKPAVSVELLPNGTMGPVEHPAAYDITLQVKTDRFRLSGGYHVGTWELLAGTSHEISNGFARGTAVVREVIYE